MSVLSDLYQIFWNPPASYVHLLVHTIGWTAIVVAVYSYVVVVIHTSRKAPRERKVAAAIAHVRARPDAVVDYGDDRWGMPRKRPEHYPWP